MNTSINPCSCKNTKPCFEENSGCEKIGYQCVDIGLPIELKPKVEIGEIETLCCGLPRLVCENKNNGQSCKIYIEQKICLKIPMKYIVDTEVGESSIRCSSNCE